MSEPRAWAVVPAAGSSRRMHSAEPKQYALIHGKPVLWHVLNTLNQSQLFSGTVLVLSEHDTRGQEIAAAFPHTMTTMGGATRLESVFLGVKALNAAPQDWVFTHDAARPCITVSDIRHLHAALTPESVGAILGYPSRDTLKRIDSDHLIQSTLDRSAIWHALTPQAFRYELLMNALHRFLVRVEHQDDKAGIEECAVMEWAGYRPLMVRGRSDNIKITYPEDLRYAELILSEDVCG